jgi:hypothetical protein
MDRNQNKQMKVMFKTNQRKLRSNLIWINSIKLRVNVMSSLKTLREH